MNTIIWLPFIIFKISFEASTTKRPGESIPQLPLSPVPVFSSSPFSTTTRPLGPDITTFRPGLFDETLQLYFSTSKNIYIFELLFQILILNSPFHSMTITKFRTLHPLVQMSTTTKSRNLIVDHESFLKS